MYAKHRQLTLALPSSAAKLVMHPQRHIQPVLRPASMPCTFRRWGGQGQRGHAGAGTAAGVVHLNMPTCVGCRALSSRRWGD